MRSFISGLYCLAENVLRNNERRIKTAGDNARACELLVGRGGFEPPTN